MMRAPPHDDRKGHHYYIRCLHRPTHSYIVVMTLAVILLVVILLAVILLAVILLAVIMLTMSRYFPPKASAIVYLATP